MPTVITRIKSDRAAMIAVMAFTALTLVGCAPASVKEINDDTPAYLAENFTAKALPASVKKQASNGQRSSFNTIDIKFDYQVENVMGNKTVTMTGDNLYTNLGNGLIQVYGQDANNGIVFSRFFSLTYGGAVELRAQTVVTGRQLANLILELKDLNKFDAGIATAQESSTYDIEGSSGTKLQLANFVDRKLYCTTGKFYPAKQVFSSLPGNALDMDCELSANGSLLAKRHFVYLQQYGLAVQLSYSNTVRNVTQTIKSIEIH